MILWKQIHISIKFWTHKTNKQLKSFLQAFYWINETKQKVISRQSCIKYMEWTFSENLFDMNISGS